MTPVEFADQLSIRANGLDPNLKTGLTIGEKSGSKLISGYENKSECVPVLIKIISLSNN